MKRDTERLARVELERRRRALLSAYRRGQHEEEELLAPRPERNELSAEQRMADLVEQLGEREVAVLREIVAALRRMDAGTWGVCEVCGKPIPDARLRAIPETRTCAEDAPAGRGTQPAPQMRELADPRLVVDLGDADEFYDESVHGDCKRCGQPLDRAETVYCDECEGLVTAEAPTPEQHGRPPRP